MLTATEARQPLNGGVGTKGGKDLLVWGAIVNVPGHLGELGSCKWNERRQRTVRPPPKETPTAMVANLPRS